ncbi:hypothetical protein AVEN_136358-1 [Araneus ventricosus]|uniref:Uncharacterized protein n=1 Tax=Araneus ventricosus TaxID=182803 RepID=A0A4Y2E4H5_ARAVE|nr:hypothetical protein AVEN_136358-1 [Araneus ventricosus]
MFASLQNLAARIGFWQTAKFSEYPSFAQTFTHAHGVRFKSEQIGNMPLQHSKSAAARDSPRKCQNGYRAAESTSLVLRKQINSNSSKRFRLGYRNCQSPSKNSIKRWHEQFKATGKVLDDHRYRTKLLND